MVRGIVFMGTPHSGSWIANWMKIPARALGVVKSVNCSLLDILDTNNQLLDFIQSSFLNTLRELRESGRPLHVTCFYEELGLHTVGHVVSRESAIFDGYNPISIHANHANMVKFASANDVGFQRVAEELFRWEEEIRTVRQPHTSSTGQSSRYLTEDSTNLASISTSAQQNGVDISHSELVDVAIKLFDLPDDPHARDLSVALMNTLNIEIGLSQVCRYHAFRKYGKERIELENARNIFQGAVEKCLKSISFVGMDNREASIAQPSKNTCQWLYKDELYLWWITEPNRILWLKGKPGSGKSTLMKSLYATRRKLVAHDSTVLLMFFFNARGAPVEKTLLALYTKMMHDLVCQVPAFLCEFLLLSTRRRCDRASCGTNWQLSQLADTFHDFIGRKQSHKVEILIDALDECNDDEVRGVVRRFEDSITAAIESGTALNVCWSSRHYPHISMESPHGVSLRLDVKNESDIIRHVQGAFPKQPDQSLASLMMNVTSRAQGIFLWAELVTQKLLKANDQGREMADLERILSSIPEQLDDLFAQIFEEVWVATGSLDQQSSLIQIAQWILFSFRPLTLRELYTALCLQSSKANGLSSPLRSQNKL